MHLVSGTAHLFSPGIKHIPEEPTEGALHIRCAVKEVFRAAGAVVTYNDERQVTSLHLHLNRTRLPKGCAALTFILIRTMFSAEPQVMEIEVVIPTGNEKFEYTTHLRLFREQYLETAITVSG